MHGDAMPDCVGEGVVGLPPLVVVEVGSEVVIVGVGAASVAEIVVVV